ncbi:MAG: hypothetical protein E7244_16370 [Enterocloster citroniae]|nr:hypothetical protein [Enterocloster citroniae]
MASNKLEVTLAALNKGQDYAILTGKSPIYSYDNGKRTSDSPIGFKVSVALQGNRLSPLSVKIEGKTDPLSKISEEEIEASCTNIELLVVRFIDCIINIYTINGQMLMSATATGVEIVK